MKSNSPAAALCAPAAPRSSRHQLTPSVCKALAAKLPPRVALRGARSVGAAWQTWVHYSGQQTFVGRLSRQAAAVAADIVLTWQQHCLTPKTAQKAAQRTLNLPAAGYSADAALMSQLRHVQTVGQMRQLLEGMLLPDAEPWEAAVTASAVQLDSPQLSGESSAEPSDGSGSTHSSAVQRGRAGPAGTAAAAAAAVASCRLRHRRKQLSPARSPAPDEGMPAGQQEEEPLLPAKRPRLSSRRWADE